MRYLSLLLPIALAACAASGGGGPVLPGRVDAPPPPMAPEAEVRLTGAVWAWQSTQMSDGARFVPDAAERYTLEFQPGSRVSVRADCNRGTGTWTLAGNELTFGPIAMTRAMCPPGSKDTEFLRGLNQVSGYLFRGGDLVLTLRTGSGSMHFSPMRP
jgi:para-nitrobenzyl esterase